MSVFVIAEPGSGHDGKFDKALELIEVAKECGADAVKFQYWSSAKRLAERRNAQEYLAVYEKYKLPTKWLSSLAKHCEKVGIEFMCTTYLPEDVNVIAPYVKRFKVASFEATDRMFLERHHPHGKPIIVSTGMCTMDQVRKLHRENLYLLLHCVTSYPCEEKDIALGSMSLTVGDVPYFDGFSDHTASTLSGAVAVGAGATLLEKHYRLETTDKDNPDYKHSLDPNGLMEYVANVRSAQVMMSGYRQGVMPCEKAMVKFQVKT